jgi:uncharacterized coiled-coil protein SlyX
MVRRWRSIGYFPILYNPSPAPSFAHLIASRLRAGQAGGAEREQHAQRLRAAAEAAAAEAAAARAAAHSHAASAAQLRPALEEEKRRAGELEALVARQQGVIVELQGTLAAQRSDIRQALTMVVHRCGDTTPSRGRAREV